MSECRKSYKKYIQRLKVLKNKTKYILARYFETFRENKETGTKNIKEQKNDKLNNE